MGPLSARIVLLALVVAVGLLAGYQERPAAAAVTVPPTLASPDDGATLTTFGPTLTWSNPPGTTQYHLQVVPANNDGPGVDLHVGSAGTAFRIPPPPLWYGLLPGMTYTWRVRVSDASTFTGLGDPSWGPWAERTFRTPDVSSATISPLMPATGEVVRTLRPVLQWGSRPDVFYYELQLSKDPSFNIDPATATAAVYWVLLHGGVTDLLNSYAVPPEFPLENNATYSWRVRPRVQGDGTPVAWSAVYSFRTDTSAPRALTVQPVAVGVEPADAACRIPGATTSFALTPTLTGVVYAFAYAGEGTASRNWFLNEQPYLVASSSLTGPSGCFSRSLGLPGGAPGSGAPLPPGTWSLEIWHAGERVQAISFIITPAPELALGPVSVGTSPVSGDPGCRLNGVGTAFPAGTGTLWFRWNTAGTGTYAMRLFRGTQAMSPLIPFSSTRPAGCDGGFLDGFGTGSWRVELSIGNEVVQTKSFTIG